MVCLHLPIAELPALQIGIRVERLLTLPSEGDVVLIFDLRYNKSPSPLMGFGMERATLCVLNDAAADEVILSGRYEIPVKLG